MSIVVIAEQFHPEMYYNLGGLLLRQYATNASGPAVRNLPINPLFPFSYFFLFDIYSDRESCGILSISERRCVAR